MKEIGKSKILEIICNTSWRTWLTCFFELFVFLGAMAVLILWLVALSG